jgi:FdhD protein
MSLDKALRAKPITRIDGAAEGQKRDDWVAVEEPLEIRVSGRSVAVVMRTPGHNRELVAGFLVTEGIIAHRDAVLDLVRCHAAAEGGGEPENTIDVVLAKGVEVDWARLTRHVFTSSSCGICSKASIAAIRRRFPPMPPAGDIRREVLVALPARLSDAQAGFSASGALHASALFDRDGRLCLVREDVGRHNALDKVVGHAFLAGELPLQDRILLLSGRVSFELMQKALAAGLSCVAALSAPTTAAVEFAEANGQTLIGFLRGERMNVYAGTLSG